VIMFGMVDRTLTEMRRVLWAAPDAGGIGFEVKLECGHQFWQAVQPGNTSYCGACLEQLIRQIRDVQSHQEPRP
jgi:hypothetical protein